MSNGQPVDPLKRLRQTVTLVALALALVHLRWPSLAIDAITVTLLIAAVLPWLGPLFKSLELPGGWKVEFQDLQRTAERAEQVGLLAPPLAAPAAAPEYPFQRIADEDPNLALAGLRIEIEKRLVHLAELRDRVSRNRDRSAGRAVHGESVRRDHPGRYQGGARGEREAG
jgi:hypothetical protein